MTQVVGDGRGETRGQISGWQMLSQGFPHPDPLLQAGGGESGAKSCLDPTASVYAAEHNSKIEGNHGDT
jgi:hypothetical protein